MLQSALLRLLNHLLDGESWARHKLQSFAGETVTLHCGMLVWQLCVAPDGTFSVECGDEEPTVCIDLPANLPFLLLADRSAIFTLAQLRGPAEFCETLAFVFRNLRWDAEADFAQRIGDIPARRLHQFLQGSLRWQVDAAQRLAANAVEYVTEEQPTLVVRRQLGEHRASIATLCERLHRLESRLMEQR